MNNLTQLDPNRTLDSVKAFPDQFQEGLEGALAIKYQPELSKVKNLVVAGMGGSALAARIIKSLFEKEFKIPFEIVSDYYLPRFVNKDSLVLAVSYSGNTEETISCLKESRERRVPVFAITTGGRLAEEIKKGLPGYIFEPHFNYLNYPKSAIGYNFGALLGVMMGMKLLPFSENDVKLQLDDFRKIQNECQESAEDLAKSLQEKIGVVVSAQYLKGAGITFRNQINELSHSFCVFSDLPEMNHHLVEAFINPKSLKQNFLYLFIKSQNYSSRISLRANITKEVLDKENIAWKEYALKTQKPLSEAIETVQLGGFTAVYLSFLNQQDPGKEPWIPFIKEKLASAHEEK